MIRILIAIILAVALTGPGYAKKKHHEYKHAAEVHKKDKPAVKPEDLEELPAFFVAPPMLPPPPPKSFLERAWDWLNQ